MATGHPTHAPYQPQSLAEKLLNQADGDSTAEASIIVLTGGLGDRLLEFVLLAWEDDRMAAIDWSATRLNTGWLSGGERRLLEIADSLAAGHPVNLADTLTGLDTANSRIVVDAIAHATGVQRWGYDR